MIYLYDGSKEFNRREYATANEDDKRVHYSGYLHNDKGEDLTIDEYVKIKGWEQVCILNENDFMTLYSAQERKEFLTGPKQINREQYWDAFGVLTA